MIRTLIVDDEQPARERLRQMLNSMGGLEVIGEAEDGEEAIQRILELRPDLVFLDIQMPVLTGLEVVKALKPPRPKIIFCTAYDQYALSAFEQQAFDYLLKPVKRERLAQAVSRMRESLETSTTLPREVTLAGRVQARMLPQSAPALAGLEFAAISTAARTVGGDYYDLLLDCPGPSGCKHRRRFWQGNLGRSIDGQLARPAAESRTIASGTSPQSHRRSQPGALQHDG